jgi:hypothetical protein
LGPTLVALHVLGEGVGEDEVVEIKPGKGCWKNAMGLLYATDAAIEVIRSSCSERSTGSTGGGETSP